MKPSPSAAPFVAESSPSTSGASDGIATRSPLPGRQHTKPDPIAEEHILRVGRILPPRHVGTPEGGSEVRLTQSEQGAQMQVAPIGQAVQRARGGESAQAAAPGQPHQDAFRDVILLVPQPKHASEIGRAHV